MEDAIMQELMHRTLETDDGWITRRKRRARLDEYDEEVDHGSISDDR